MNTIQARVACRIEIHGTVQGVGFRPFVYRLGRGLGVDGSVRNDDGLVVVEAAGPPETIATLAARLRTDAPARARVSELRIRELDGGAPAPGAGFTVEPSVRRGPAGHGPELRRTPPDLATCEACLAELFDPGDRRYRYAFVNCTDCGPRATIIDALPYDRARTTMDAFAMCADCAAEYADPADRRFHAEPIACPVCGPRLAWHIPGQDAARGEEDACGEDALRAAETCIRGGGIVALKGLGGYQLVCDATDEAAVGRLRARKHRPAKPLAVMVGSLAAARHLARVDDAEAAPLTSVARPVVLVEARPGRGLASAVAPGAPRLGLFLPYSPLHHLLLADLDRPLVVTSGNLSAEPIAIDDADARRRLAGLADGFLTHDRPIRSRYDDSVTHVVAGRASVVRRARGYAPEPIDLPVPAPEPLLAVGGQLKHTFTVARGGTAVTGPHTGDLEQQATMEAFTANLAHLCRVVGAEPHVVAHDLHPGYLSTQYAATLPVHRRIGVQHHHAHVASCAAEHGVTGPFIGVAYDGLGLGDDGTLWGGEVFVADLATYRRVARFGRAPLPGGAAAVRRPVRMALGYLFGGEGLDERTRATALRLARPLLRRLPPREVSTVRRMVERGVNCPVASSAGRLFDAAAALLDLRDDATYEGEAAVALEAAAGPGGAAPELPWRLVARDGMLVYDATRTLLALLEGRRDGVDVAVLAARFHATVAAVTIAVCSRVAARHGLRTVCLSGGVMQNRLLAEALLGGLSAAGLEPLINERVPVNDGGISYGQAAVAAARLRRG
ncbi:carbamoyltransferase HypF [Dactylosporangium aurantiacum]|uniref:Carbamoyltransferase n=1 Tax=Dactylosporangium aurantiacum TaxID=35754 RepID=A0A9Q9I7N5_9ACTN|nr:carbamoyltransferase HypF [Dactylosporangium aurantiacum]MDG6107293.1 carbamoyltransferase HypF [Dactylosporangium aurantiacum]UWZ51179.1 carbamoyltransferase HypF [Dactylosporangium aurantiacum]